MRANSNPVFSTFDFNPAVPTSELIKGVKIVRRGNFVNNHLTATPMSQPTRSRPSSNDETHPLDSLWPDWLDDPDAEEEEFKSDFFQGSGGRRRKAAFAIAAVWGTTAALHLSSWGIWLAWGLTGVVVAHVTHMVLARPNRPEVWLEDADLETAPSVSILVAAKNEEAVVENLAQMLCQLDYPADKYEVWIVDDASSDRTGALLDELVQTYSQLNVLHRSPNAGGGKSGALNQVLPRTTGEIVAVFDADAQVPSDLLRQVVPLFAAPTIGAVQVRKAIANAETNNWTKGQMAEMALDSYLQQQRIHIGGIGELRGNGQFVRRVALKRCGGWNEETITDDLDLTFRLHFDRWDIDFLLMPGVGEEGVVNAQALWHQRNRWAEGGYQRYLDYWRVLARTPMGVSKTLDLVVFAILQYILPVAVLPDTLLSLYRHRFPLFAPMSGFMLAIAFWGMTTGLRRVIRQERGEEPLPLPVLLAIFGHSVRGFLFWLHWAIVVPSVAMRIAVRPKRLKWVKTVRQASLNAVRNS